MFANTEGQNQPQNNYSNRDYNNNRGRGRGGRYYNRGRGRGRYNDRYNDHYYDNIDLSKITCYQCDKKDHYASSCLDRLLKLQETAESVANSETQEAEYLMVNEVVYLNEKNVNPQDFEKSSDRDNIWYLDNGASNHMTGSRNFFKTIDESITGKVRFGDDSRIDIKGKGSIMLCGKDGGRKIINDVYFIPALKSNIISLGQATESGCEVMMRENYLILQDKDGRLITKAKR